MYSGLNPVGTTGRVVGLSRGSGDSVNGNAINVADNATGSRFLTERG